jgi:hypothetical protein
LILGWDEDDSKYKVNPNYGSSYGTSSSGVGDYRSYSSNFSNHTPQNSNYDYKPPEGESIKKSTISM